MAGSVIYKHVFFDLDRTLWDTDKNAADTIKILVDKYKLNERGVHSPDKFAEEFNVINEYFWTLYGQDKITKDQLRLQRFVDILGRYGIQDYTLCHKLSNDFTEITPRNPGLIPGALELLDYLKERKYILHVLTNGFNEIQRIKLRSSKIESYFKKVITAEDAEAKKPSKKYFDYALAKSSALASDSIMVGDNPDIDIAGALDSGIDCVLFNPFKIAHNYAPQYEIMHLADLRMIL